MDAENGFPDAEDVAEVTGGDAEKIEAGMSALAIVGQDDE